MKIFKIGLVCLLFEHAVMMSVYEMKSSRPSYTYQQDDEDGYGDNTVDCSKCRPSHFIVGTTGCFMLLTAALINGLDRESKLKTCLTYVSSDANSTAQVEMTPFYDGHTKKFSLKSDEKKCIDGYSWKEIGVFLSQDNFTKEYIASDAKASGNTGRCAKRYLKFYADSTNNVTSWYLNKCDKDEKSRKLHDEKSYFSNLGLKDIMDPNDIMQYHQKTTSYLRGDGNFR